MIDLLAQTASPISGATNAGPFGSLVVAVTVAMTAISLILVQVLRGWKKWKPVGEFFPDGAIRIATLCAAAAMVLAFHFLRTPDTTTTLVWTLIAGALGALCLLMIYNYLYSRRVFTQMLGIHSSGNLVKHDILGGFLTEASKTKLRTDANLTEQMLVDGCNGNLDLVWQHGSRGTVANFFLLAFTGLVTFAALAGTAIGLFTLLLTGVIPNDLKVRVPATVLLSQSVSPNEIAIGNGGFILIPAGHRAVFVSGTANKWTNDRLKLIEQRLSSNQHYEVDVTRLIAIYEAAGRDRNRFVELMKSEFDILVDERWTSTFSTNPFFDFELEVRKYVGDDVFNAIADCSQRSNPKYSVALESEPSGVKFNFRRAVWKRIVLVALRYNVGFESQLGPYFKITAKDAPEPGNGPDGSPAPNERAGSLVGGLMIADDGEGRSSVKIGSATPFANPGDAIENRGTGEAIARLGMNDRIPDDNGDGYAVVTYRIERIQEAEKD